MKFLYTITCGAVVVSIIRASLPSPADTVPPPRALRIEPPEHRQLLGGRFRRRAESGRHPQVPSGVGADLVWGHAGVHLLEHHLPGFAIEPQDAQARDHTRRAAPDQAHLLPPPPAGPVAGGGQVGYALREAAALVWHDD